MDFEYDKFVKCVNDVRNRRKAVKLQNGGTPPSSSQPADSTLSTIDDTISGSGEDALGSPALTQAPHVADEELARQIRLQKVGAGFSAYNSTVGQLGQSFGVDRVNRDMQANDIRMSQDLRSSGTYANVQENVNNANDHSKQQQVMAARDNIIGNVSSMGPYGAMIGAGLQAVSTVMDSSGLTGKIFNRQTEAERQNAERQARVASGIVSEGQDVIKAGQNGSAEATAIHNLSGEQTPSIRLGEGGMEMQDNNRHKFADLDDSSFNVIPNGALHVENHHLGAIDPEYNELTRKGIPVISEEDGELIQHAEIERGEIILRLALTEALTNLASANTYEAQVAAGKLVADELLHNTKDNVGIIKSLKKNGQVQG